MSEELRLLPNLGGEERGEWRRGLKQPRVAAAARLWRLLFPDSARVLDDCASLSALDWNSWPAALASDRERAAFPWLEDVSGCVAWLGDQHAHEDPAAAACRVTGPAGEIVEHVHDKAFALHAAEQAALIPDPLRGTAHVFAPADLENVEQTQATIRACTRRWPGWTSGSFTLKPRIGTSGRGRLDASDGRLDAQRLAAALPRLARSGGAILEPWLERSRDFSVQLKIDEAGAVVVLGTLEQIVSPTGTWLGHRGEVDSRGRIFSGRPEEESLREAGAEIAAVAAQAGFFGPAAVDALTFHLKDGENERTLLRPVVELNARFTMGTVAVGLLRRVLGSVRRELALDPGERRAFLFAGAAPPPGWEAVRATAGPSAFFVPLWCDGESVQPGLLFAADAPELDRALSVSLRP